MDHIKRSLKFLCAFILTSTSSVVFAQAGLQGPFVPIGPEVSSSGPTTATTNVLFKATDINGQDVYASGDVTHSESQVANQLKQKANDPNGASIGAAVEAAGYALVPPNGINTAGDSLPGEYNLATLGVCRHTNPADSSPETNVDVQYCASQLKAHALGSWPTLTWLGGKCWRGVYGIKYEIDIGGIFTAGSIENIWDAGTIDDVCAIDGSPLPDPGEPAGTPSDSELFGLATSGTPPIINNFNYYYQTNNNSIDNSYSNIQTLSNTLTSNYDTATSTTAGAGLPAGYSREPTGTSGGSGGGSSGGGEDTDDDICAVNPNIAACLDGSIGSIPAAESLAETEIPLTYTPVAITGNNACPTPISETVGGVLLTFENDYVCDALVSIEPVVLTLFSLAGLYIIIGFRRNT